MEEKINAVIYAKYYGEDNRLNELSIEEQIKRCRKYAKENNINIIKEYIDLSYYENANNRQNFEQMVEDSKKQDFQIVIVNSFDRFALSKYDSVIYKQDLKQNNVKVVSVTEDAAGVLIENILESFLDYIYSKQLVK